MKWLVASGSLGGGFVEKTPTFHTCKNFSRLADRRQASLSGCPSRLWGAVSNRQIDLLVTVAMSWKLLGWFVYIKIQDASALKSRVSFASSRQDNKKMVL